MDAILTQIGQAFISQGLTGSIAVILGGVVWYLWRDSRTKDRQLITILTDWRSDTALSNEKLYVALETLKAVMAQGGRIK